MPGVLHQIEHGVLDHALFFADDGWQRRLCPNGTASLEHEPALESARGTFFRGGRFFWRRIGPPRELSGVANA